MKHKSSFVIVYWWLLVLLVCGVLLMAFAEKEPRISETEKRELSGFPEFSLESLASGDFFLGIESYLSDGVWGRDRIVGVSESLLGVFCANTAEEAALLEDAAMADELQGVAPGQQPQVQTPAESEIPENQEPLPGVTEAAEEELPAGSGKEFSSVEDLTGCGLWRIREDGTCVEYASYSDQAVQAVANMLNGFKNALPEDGRVFYTNVPMTGTALAARDSYSSWYENIDECLSQYTIDGVTIINTPALLEEPLWAGEDVYFTSDHHWTPLGALIVANECLRLQGIPTVPYEEYTYTVGRFSDATKNTSDDLAMLHPLQDPKGNRMTLGQEGDKVPLINYNIPHYGAYLGGDHPVWTRFVSGFSTGRKALVIGDSFTNAFTPYLLPYYDEVHKVDARYYEPQQNGGSMAELIRKYGIDDVYIILCQANGVRSDTSQNKLWRALNGD